MTNMEAFAWAVDKVLMTPTTDTKAWKLLQLVGSDCPQPWYDLTKAQRDMVRFTYAEAEARIKAAVAPTKNDWMQLAGRCLYEIVKPEGGLEWDELTDGQREEWAYTAHDSAGDADIEIEGLS